MGRWFEPDGAHTKVLVRSKFVIGSTAFGFACPHFAHICPRRWAFWQCPSSVSARMLGPRPSNRCPPRDPQPRSRRCRRPDRNSPGGHYQRHREANEKNAYWARSMKPTGALPTHADYRDACSISEAVARSRDSKSLVSSSREWAPAATDTLMAAIVAPASLFTGTARDIKPISSS